LLLEVRLENANRSTITTGGKIRRRAENAFAIARPPVWSFAAKHSARNAFQAVHQSRYGVFCWIVHKQVNVVVFAVHRSKFCLEIAADLGKDGAKSVESIFVQHPMSILCDEVNVKLENAS
jgi:hypothetical protein